MEIYYVLPMSFIFVFMADDFHLFILSRQTSKGYFKGVRTKKMYRTPLIFHFTEYALAFA